MKSADFECKQLYAGIEAVISFGEAQSSGSFWWVSFCEVITYSDIV